jgi:hypothetical protein
MRLYEIDGNNGDDARVKRLKDTAKQAKDKAKQLGAQANLSGAQLKAKRAKMQVAATASIAPKPTISL